MESKLVDALETRKLKLAKILIEGGEDVNARSGSGKTALMTASGLLVSAKEETKKLEIINQLLEKGADIKAKDNAGRTALFYANHVGCAKTIQLLKGKGLVYTVEVKKSKRSRQSEERIWGSLEL